MPGVQTRSLPFSCTACLDACPTGALTGPNQLDATRCIAYWTIEARGAFTAATPGWKDWVGGCDVCQEVCPWNRYARPTDDPRFVPKEALRRPDPDLFTNTQRVEELQETLAGGPLKRTGAAALQRNALLVRRACQSEHDD